MDKAQISFFAQSKFYLIAMILIAASALLRAFEGEWATCIVSLAAIAALALGKAIAHPNNTKFVLQMQTILVLMVVVWVISLYVEMPELSYWTFALPAITVFFFDIKKACIAFGVAALAVMTMVDDLLPIFTELQFIIGFTMCISISLGMIILRDARLSRLEPLRKTDNLTRAATREHLDDDLTKEIQRSEREGSDLAVLALAIDESSLSKMSDARRSTLAIDLGRLLHNNLRVFDSYYLWEPNQFLIVLPHTSSLQANKIADQLRIKARKEIQINQDKISISIGIAGLNVGDDSKLLPERAEHALALSKKKGENRTRIYREEDAVTDAGIATP